MALAYTELPTVYQQIAATPPLTFLAALKTTLLSVGWEWVSAYDNGDLYQIESPQHLKVRVRIWYPNSASYPNCFALQLQSANTPSLTGLTHHFLAGFAPLFAGDTRAFTHYAVWANCCSIFIGAVHAEPWKNRLLRAVQAAVPFTFLGTEPTPECASQMPTAPLTNELFWSSGDDTGAGYNVDTSPDSLLNFRNSYFCQRYTLIHNGNDLGAIIGNPVLPAEARVLQLCILKSNVYWNGLSIDWPDGFIRPDDTPLAYDPLIAAAGGYIFGALYDACLLSRPMELEAVEQILETQPVNKLTTWVNYTKSHGVFISTFNNRNEGRCYSLLLLRDPPEEQETELNVAY